MVRSAGRAPTLATVAAEAGVSRQTVSNALNNPHLLRTDTLHRVRAAIEVLGYSPNRAARNLRTRSSRLIGLRMDAVAEDSENAQMDRFVRSLVEHTEHAGYHVLLFGSGDEDPVAGYDNLLRSTAVDAFVITDTYRGNPQAAWLHRRGAPFVAFGRPWQNPAESHPWVDVDGAAGVSVAVEHLVERGHRRIAWVGWPKDSLIGEDRRTGWHASMHEHGLPSARMAARGENTLASGRRAALALLESEAPTAFVCASDTMAIGVLHALTDSGLEPGRDVAVVGFDDSVAASFAAPGLTSVRQPLEQVAAEIVSVLGTLLAHRPIDEPGRILQPTLTVRASTRERLPGG